MGLMFVLLHMSKNGGNLSTMIYVLTYVVSHEIFGLFTPFYKLVGAMQSSRIANMPQMTLKYVST
jgi:hypothetical protein